MFAHAAPPFFDPFCLCFVSSSSVPAPAVASLILFSPRFNEQHQDDKKVEFKPRDGRVRACGGVVSMSLYLCNWVLPSNGERRVGQQAEGGRCVCVWLVSAHLSVHHLPVVATSPSVFAAPHLSFSLILRHCLFIGIRVRQRLLPSYALAFSRGLLHCLPSLSRPAWRTAFSFGLLPSALRSPLLSYPALPTPLCSRVVVPVAPSR